MKWFVFVTAFLVGASAFAFRFSPMVVKFSPAGPGTNQVLTLDNPTGDKIAVQIEIFKRIHDGEGKETREKTSDFVVYPEQVALAPKEKRNVRVTWSGDTAPASELAYRIIATQLPIGFKEKNAKADAPKASLNIMLQYVASAYVVPGGVKSDVKAGGFTVKGETGILKIANRGQAHQLVSKAKLVLKDAGGKVAAELKEPKELEALNLLAGEERTVDIAVPKNLKAGDYSTELTFEGLSE